MRIEQGTNRVAVIGENLTVKVPKQHINWARHSLDMVFRSIPQGRFKDVMALLASDERYPGSLRHIFLAGMFENLNEAKLSEELGSSRILTPTWMSVVGCLNVQETAIPITLPKAELWGIFTDALGADKTVSQSHTFAQKENFGLHECKVKFVDYGSKKLGQLITENKEKIQRALDQLTERLTR